MQVGCEVKRNLGFIKYSHHLLTVVASFLLAISVLNEASLAYFFGDSEGKVISLKIWCLAGFSRETALIGNMRSIEKFMENTCFLKMHEFQDSFHTMILS